MAKTKKKRNKKYTGADAADARPTIIRVQAANRSKFGQWLFERRALLKRLGQVILAVLIVSLLISGLISLL